MGPLSLADVAAGLKPAGHSDGDASGTMVDIGGTVDDMLRMS